MRINYVHFVNLPNSIILYMATYLDKLFLQMPLLALFSFNFGQKRLCKSVFLANFCLHSRMQAHVGFKIVKGYEDDGPYTDSCNWLFCPFG